MSALGWFTLIAVLTVVWGGFLLALFVALRREREKQRSNPRIRPPGRQEPEG